jgi:hypothetical protein
LAREWEWSASSLCLSSPLLSSLVALMSNEQDEQTLGGNRLQINQVHQSARSCFGFHLVVNPGNQAPSRPVPPPAPKLGTPRSLPPHYARGIEGHQRDITVPGTGTGTTVATPAEPEPVWWILLEYSPPARVCGSRFGRLHSKRMDALIWHRHVPLLPARQMLP